MLPFKMAALPSFFVHPGCSVKIVGFSKSAHIPRDPKHKIVYLKVNDLESFKGCEAS